MDDPTNTDAEATAQDAAPSGDDRKSEVDPASDPRPLNPPIDEDALARGEEQLDRVKPY